MKFGTSQNQIMRCDRCGAEDTTPPFKNMTQAAIGKDTKDLCLKCHKALEEWQLRFLKQLKPK